MDREQESRLVNAVEKIAEALAERTRIERERFDKQFPPEKAKLSAEINFAGDEQRENFNDRPDADWLAQTEAAIPKSRFQERFERDAPQADTADKKK